jgi:tetratricopeptide (TPR) repeat protein
VPQTRHSSVITLSFNPPALRWLLLIPALLAVTGAAFAVRWYVGNTVADYTSTPDEDGIEMARLAVRWAPGNALAHWRLGSLQERNFSASNLAAAVSEYRSAVEVGPYDFRFWLELGRALEAAGDNQNAERALRRAVELAPSYSQPHWQYGNLLVREGRIDEAFTHLSKAAESDSRMQAPVFVLAAQVFGDDQAALARALPSSAVRLQLALSLIQLGKPEAAMAIARSVPAADRKAQSTMTDELINAFIERHRYQAALSLMRDSGNDPASLAAPEEIWNGGFENPLGEGDRNIFHWAISSRSAARIDLDYTQAHSGKGSLRIVFKSPAKLDSIPIGQTVMVEPDTQYKMQFYVRTEGLLSAVTPLVAVKDLTGQLLASSPPVASGTHDWQAVTLIFKSRPQEEGIQIFFGREACDQKDPVCPIFGTVWYDDFTLQRVGGADVRTASPANSRH